MKILILSCSTGGGHNTAARAVKECLELHGHEAVLLDPFSLSGKRTADFVGNAYIQLAKHAPGFFGFLYRFADAISSCRRKSPVYYVNRIPARRLYAYLQENPYDAIVMPHLYPAEMVTYLKKKYSDLPPTVAVATDYTCIPFWEETRCDHYILPHIELLEENLKKGMSAENLHPYGIPVGQAFSRHSSKEAAKQKLHLPKDKPVLLVMSGSMGFGKMHLFVFELTRKLTNGEQLIIICGNNRKTYRILKGTYRRNANVHITGYTEHVADYMAASDVVFTKPGGLTSTEALVRNIPIVHTAPIPGCETKNREFFVSRGLSLASEHVHTQISQGLTLLHNTELRNAMIATQQKYAKPDAAMQIVELLLRLTSGRDAANV